MSSLSSGSPTVSDQLWSTFSAAFIFFMQAGFVLLEAGSVSTNVQNILLNKVAMVLTCTLCWFVLGFSILVGTDFSPFAGYSSDYAGGFVSPISTVPRWFFSLTFDMTTAMVVSGALAERTAFIVYPLMSAFVSLCIHPVIGHWVWSSDTGFLNQLRVIDLAGCGPVHLAGSVCAFVGARMVGPRFSMSTQQQQQQQLQLQLPSSLSTGSRNSSRFLLFQGDTSFSRRDAHGPLNKWKTSQLTFMTLGVFIMCTGFFFFNAACVLSLSAGLIDVASLVLLNTLLAGAASGLGVLILVRLSTGKHLVEPVLNGSLAGLVAITGPAAVFTPWTSTAVGLLSALAYVGSVRLLRPYIDDPLEAVALHGGAALVGILASGLFYSDSLLDQAYSTASSSSSSSSNSNSHRTSSNSSNNSN